MALDQAITVNDTIGNDHWRSWYCHLLARVESHFYMYGYRLAWSTVQVGRKIGITPCIAGNSGTIHFESRTPTFRQGILFFLNIYQISIEGLSLFPKYVSGASDFECLVRTLYRVRLFKIQIKHMQQWKSKSFDFHSMFNLHVLGMTFLL